MLMDMFYDGVQVPKKRRAHFGAFMVDVHKRKNEILPLLFIFPSLICQHLL